MGVRTPALFRYSPNCALKFLNQFRRKAFQKSVLKTKDSIKTMYQQHSLGVFQCYVKKGSNECGIKECGTKECGINFGETAFNSQTEIRIFNSMAVILYLSVHMLSYFRVIHNL